MDEPTTHEPNPGKPISARDLALVVGGADLADLARHHLDLTLAVAELARSAGRDWPWTGDDPTVALIRAVAKVALLAPEAESTHAHRLIEALGHATPE